jgi:hypothetical protein
MADASMLVENRTSSISGQWSSTDYAGAFVVPVLTAAILASLTGSAVPLIEAWRNLCVTAAQEPMSLAANRGAASMTTLGDPFAWGWILATLPLLLVVQHFLMLWLFKGRPQIKMLSGGEVDRVPRGLKMAREEARESVDRYFRLWMLMLRYTLPALLLFWSILLGTAFLFAKTGNVLNGEWDIRVAAEMSKAARFGAAGAYVYVLLYLGQRTFHRDISVGVVCWCIVTIIAGPILAASLSRFIASSAESGWGTLALYFLAGLAPRHVVQMVQDKAKQILGASSGPAGPEDLSPRLTSIPGICPDIAERLGEEGICGVANLAMANPYGLLRNTPFDMRQITSWMDQALLILTLPDQWQALNKLGVTGVIDLAWCADHQVAALATAMKVDSPPTFQATVERLRQDAQVLLLWALYQGSIGDDEDVAQETHREAASEPSNLSRA